MDSPAAALFVAAGVWFFFWGDPNLFTLTKDLMLAATEYLNRN